MWQMNVSTTPEAREFLLQSGLSIGLAQPMLDGSSDLMFTVSHVTPIDMVFADKFSLKWTSALSVFFSTRTYESFETVQINLQSSSFDREDVDAHGARYLFDGTKVTPQSGGTPGIIAVAYQPDHGQTKTITVGLTETICDGATATSVTSPILSTSLDRNETVTLQVPMPLVYIFTISNYVKTGTIIPTYLYIAEKSTMAITVESIKVGFGLKVDVSQNNVGVTFDLKSNSFRFK